MADLQITYRVQKVREAMEHFGDDVASFARRVGAHKSTVENWLDTSNPGAIGRGGQISALMNGPETVYRLEPVLDFWVVTEMPRKRTSGCIVTPGAPWWPGRRVTQADIDKAEARWI